MRIDRFGFQKGQSKRRSGLGHCFPRKSRANHLGSKRACRHLCLIISKKKYEKDRDSGKNFWNVKDSNKKKSNPQTRISRRSLKDGRYIQGLTVYISPHINKGNPFLSCIWHGSSATCQRSRSHCAQSQRLTYQRPNGVRAGLIS